MLTSLSCGRLIVVTLLASFAVTSPAGAAGKSPEELIRNLNDAAARGDVDAFLAELTADSRDALKEAEARRASLRQLGQEFRGALDERFGKGGETLEDSTDTLAAAIAHVAGTELIGQAQRPDGAVELRVRLPVPPAPGMKSDRRKSKTKAAKPAARVETLLARREGDAWKLSLNLPPAGDLAPQVAAAKRVTERVRGGQFKDRLAAMVEWSEAWTVKEAGK